MRVVPHPATASAPAPYAAAETAFAEAKAYLSSREALQMSESDLARELHRSSREALQMSESDLERELHRRGQELMQKLLPGHLDQRSPGEAAGPVAGTDGIERRERRVHERDVETTFGTVQVERLGYARAGHDSLHPLDASLNLPVERYSLEVRRQVAEAAASRSFDEARLDLSRHTGAEVPKRQAEQLAVRAAEDFDAFYDARRAAAGEPASEKSVVVLTFDGKGVVLHREDLRAATRRAAERRRRQREQLFPFPRLQPGEKKHAKRMATVAAVYAVAPFVRSPEEFLQSLMPRQPGDKTQAKKARTSAVRPRPVAKRVWASLEREPAEVTAEAMLEAERHDPERVKRWVVLVDGAETQLDLVEAGAAVYGVEVTVVLDIIHVVEYVWKAAHVFHREGSPELACWAWTRVRDILEGKASRVAASMRRAATVAGLSSDTRKPVDTCADYLLKYAPYLHYDRYLAAGYPIATGVIEGACRHLVRDRMELTGARWRLVGAEAVLKLRALRASGDFDAYWDFHEAREYERNHAQRYADGIAPPVTEPPPSPSSSRLRRVK
ncbi:MAG: ISKra4 family transposase [Acidobacteria bacterium]|nr:ISKra4 family transposase [Acidobacteriota bacterium]